MYPKNKPLPPEAAGRAASVVIKSGYDKSQNNNNTINTNNNNNNNNSNIIIINGASGLGGSASARRVQSGGNCTSTIPPQCPPQTNIPPPPVHVPLRVPQPPSYIDSVKDGPLFDDGGFNENGAAAGFHATGAKTTSASPTFQKKFLSLPPYEMMAANPAEGGVDKHAYDPYYGVGGGFSHGQMMIPPPPPSLPHSIAPPGVAVDGLHPNKHQMHTFIPPHTQQKPQQQTEAQGHLPWPPSGDVMNHLPNPPPPCPLMEPPRYNESNVGGVLPGGAVACYYPQNSLNGIHGNTRWNNSFPPSRERDGNFRTVDENHHERRREKGENSNNDNNYYYALHSRQLSTGGNSLAQGQDKHQQTDHESSPLSSLGRENRSQFFQQHRQSVTLLIQVIVVLLERLWSTKSALRTTHMQNDSKAEENSHVSSASAEGNGISAGIQHDEDISILKEQLSELQDALSSIQKESITAGAQSNRRRLLDGILTLPQFLPLTTAVSFNAHEEVSSSFSSDSKAFTEETLAASYEVMSEVKTLMKALDFETTRPITLNLVSPSPPLSSSSFSALSFVPAANAKRNPTPSASDKA